VFFGISQNARFFSPNLPFLTKVFGHEDYSTAKNLGGICLLPPATTPLAKGMLKIV